MIETKTNKIAAVGNVLLSLDKSFQDEIILNNGAKLFIDPSYNPEFNVTVTGKVQSLPENLIGEGGEIVAELNEGDEVAFNFRVVMSRKYLPKKDTFLPIEDTQIRKTFLDNKRNKIKINALPFKGGLNWVGVLLDNRGNVIDGAQGTQSEVERWFSQFTIGYDAPFFYTNLLEHEGTTLWRAEPRDIYAKKVKGGVGIKAIGDRVIMKEIVIDASKRVAITQGIHIPDGSILSTYTDKAKVVSGGEKLGIKRGDEVFFEPMYVEKYNFFGQEYLVIKNTRIHAIY